MVLFSVDGAAIGASMNQSAISGCMAQERSLLRQVGDLRNRQALAFQGVCEPWTSCHASSRLFKMAGKIGMPNISMYIGRRRVQVGSDSHAFLGSNKRSSPVRAPHAIRQVPRKVGRPEQLRALPNVSGWRAGHTGRKPTTVDSSNDTGPSTGFAALLARRGGPRLRSSPGSAVFMEASETFRQFGARPTRSTSMFLTGGASVGK